MYEKTGLRKKVNGKCDGKKKNADRYQKCMSLSF
jgi:hypothetical protein